MVFIYQNKRCVRVLRRVDSNGVQIRIITKKKSQSGTKSRGRHEAEELVETWCRKHGEGEHRNVVKETVVFNYVL